jgi:hypothetical protein
MSLALASSLAAADVPTSAPTSPAQLSADAIVNKNVAARGGLQAWRAVQTMSLAGRLAAGGNHRATLALPAPGGRRSGQNVTPPRPLEEAQLPFLMELKRPRKMRFEIQFSGQTAVQVYDGAHGWKLRPFLNRRVVEPYSEDEMRVSSTQADLDGPLVDYAAKGTKVELAGTEKVEDRDTYKLKLTLKSGEAIHVWIDAKTFLEAKIEGQPRRLDGTYHPVEVYFRDFRAVSGLQIPYTLETKVLPVGKTAMGLKDPPVPAEKIVIESVVVNPKLDEALFTKPAVEVASNANAK